ncbi:MAG: hypothetical protein AAF674_10540 [Pseudomonadota bacterium]
MAIDLLCEIIAQGGRVSAEAYCPQRGYKALIRACLLRETGVIQSVVCMECDGPHDAEVIHHNGRDGYWCPDLGFVPLDRPALTALAPDLTALVAKLADAFACKRRKSTPVHGATWRVGAVETHAGDLAVYLHPRLMTGGDVQEADGAVRSQVGSAYAVILTAAGSLVVPGAKTLHLADVVALEQDGDALVATADLALAIGVQPVLQTGRPNKYGDRLRSIITARDRDGETSSGTNKEARAIQDAFRRKHPGEQAPSIPTVKRYLAAFQAGS